MPDVTLFCPVCKLDFTCESRPRGRMPKYCSRKCRKDNAAALAAAGISPLVRQKHPTTADREYSEEEVELLKAVDAYRKRNKLRFMPTACEVLAVVKEMGYRKVC